MAFRDGRHRGGLHPFRARARRGSRRGGLFCSEAGARSPLGGEKSSALGLRAAPATIGKPPCNRERSPHLDELMNRGLITGIVGRRAKTRERARVGESP